MIRVLHIVGTLDAGGFETLIMNIYRKIDTSQVQFDFVVHRKMVGLYEQEITDRGGKVYHIPFLDDKNYGEYKNQLTKVIKDGDYRIVHGHHSSLGPLYLKIAQKAGVPIRIAHSHTGSHIKSAKGYVKHLITRRYKSHATHLFACSNNAGRYMFGRNSSFRVVNNGIDTAKFRFDPAVRSELRKKMGLENDFVVCHVGRFDTVKNHTFIVDVFKELLTLHPQSKLMLIGIGPLEEPTKAKVRELGLTDKVLFMGQITNVHQMLSAADAFLFPSLYEGLPLTLVEAQTAGLPVICSDTITDECHLTEDYDILSLNDSAQAWAQAVMKAKDSRIPREERYLLIREKGYDCGDVADGLIRFYQDALRSDR